MSGSPNYSSRLHLKTQRLRRLKHELARKRIRSVRNAFYRQLWSDASTRLNFQYYHLGSSAHRISNGKRAIEFIGSAIPLDQQETAKRIGDKQLLYKAYQELGIATPPQARFSKSTTPIALDFLRASGGPCVVKPIRDTGGGQGVTVGIDTIASLKPAIKHAATYGDELLIETELSGADYRLLYLDGKLLDVVRRDRPTVVGDGRSTIRDLVKKENSNRLDTPPIKALSLLTIDSDMHNAISRAGWKLDASPEEGMAVRIKGACNQNAAHENHHCEADIDASTLTQINSIIKHFDARLVGVDVICKNITMPMTPDNGYICEINTYPGLHHHFLTTRTSSPTFLVDEILSQALPRT